MTDSGRSILAGALGTSANLSQQKWSETYGISGSMSESQITQAAHTQLQPGRVSARTQRVCYGHRSDGQYGERQYTDGPNADSYRPDQAYRVLHQREPHLRQLLRHLSRSQ